MTDEIEKFFEESKKQGLSPFTKIHELFKGSKAGATLVIDALEKELEDQKTILKSQMDEADRLILQLRLYKRELGERWRKMEEREHEK